MSKILYVMAIFIMIAIAFVVYVPRTQDVDIYAGDLGIQLLVADHLLRYKDIRFDGEISSFDGDGNHIIHNSPIGYYFYALLYLLGGKTIEGYLMVYYALSIVQAVSLFVFGFIVFGPPGGLVILALSLFSRGAIALAGFPSQMTNSVFVESVAIGIFGLYIRSRRPVLFWTACLLSLLATQLYPPMYLLIIPKIILFLYRVRRIPLSLICLFIVGTLSLYIFTPLIVQEYVYHGNNLAALQNFLNQPGGSLSLIEIIKRFAMNMHMLFSSLNWYSSRYTAWPVASIVLLGAVLYRKKLRAVLFVFILTMALIPAAILAFHPSQPYVVPSRAYLMVAFPYVWLFAGNMVALLPKQFIYIMMILFVTVSIWGTGASRHSKSTPILVPSRGVVDSIVDDMKTRRVDVGAVDLFVISPDDSRSWDAGLYWYELERVIGKRLSRIEYVSSKARRINQRPVRTIYLVCHRIVPEDVEKQCKSVFEQERMENSYGALYQLVDAKHIMNRSYFVYQQ